LPRCCHHHYCSDNTYRVIIIIIIILHATASQFVLRMGRHLVDLVQLHGEQACAAVGGILGLFGVLGQCGCFVDDDTDAAVVGDDGTRRRMEICTINGTNIGTVKGLVAIVLQK
jgi:hypothetical protein